MIRRGIFQAVAGLVLAPLAIGKHAMASGGYIRGVTLSRLTPWSDAIYGSGGMMHRNFGGPLPSIGRAAVIEHDPAEESHQDGPDLFDYASCF